MGKPASGKSTWAKTYVTNDSHTLRVNKDEIRKMLYKSDYTADKEEVVDAIERAAIFSSLGRGYDIIVDATNFNLDRLQQFGKFTGYPSELHWFQADVATCLKRNSEREAKVPDHVIRDMYVKERELEGLVAFDDLFGKVVIHK